jgi:hypothetical protein
MAVKRLKETGHFDGEAKVAADKLSLDKAVLMVYTGKFESMDGPVEIKDEDIEKLAANHNTLMSKLGRLAAGNIHPRHNPPLQLDHSTSAKDTVGRLVGNLSVGEHTLEDGTKVKALMGTARVLGKENVEKVEDGRWAHLSGGFDLENHKVSELTITPFPAAGEAHMLSKNRLVTSADGPIAEEGEHQGEPFVVICKANGAYEWRGGGTTGSEDTQAKAAAAAKHAIDTVKKGLTNSKLSSEDTMGYKETKEKADLYAKCKKHLTEHKKMSEEDADKHLEAAKPEELTAMGAEHDEHEKKLAADTVEKAEKEKLAALAGQKANLIKLAKGFKTSGAKVQLAEKESKIVMRLGRLQSQAKISPAEVKGLKVAELAAKGDDVIEATLSSYEKRSPVIDPGIYGSTKGLTAASLAPRLKKMNMEREELQTRLNMPSKREAALVRLAEIEKEEKLMDQSGTPHMAHEEPDGDEEKRFADAYAEHGRLTAEGKAEEAKEHLRSYMKSLKGHNLAEGHVPDPTPHMSALAAEVKKMQTDFEEFVKLAAPAFGATAEELK